jgi:hypothetical protein
MFFGGKLAIKNVIKLRLFEAQVEEWNRFISEISMGMQSLTMGVFCCEKQAVLGASELGNVHHLGGALKVLLLIPHASLLDHVPHILVSKIAHEEVGESLPKS